ncbi:TPA: hypothetical protein GND40_003574 [Salmonella enterica subsp. indica]|uniref:Eaa protein n=2 Tax=Salmonella enterica TaxID=28901 RepID=A0A753E1Q2_SALER|nr:hypothetical protein [Salmonella enterica subsp. enterica serovar Typhimurium]EEM2503899.1 hypothetical protein [Salmonella enterica subsp. indica serovar 45:a:e,n,x]HAF7947592.1 hypothetical protein [Salmonella enterica subsp. indica]HCM6292216.1 hypothetical protein [Salmonella enterica subsp. enterica serovar 16:l,v:-]EBB5093165.1 hypothetical protein [Salmonella enterica subsp. enterica serovar Typhimurium]
MTTITKERIELFIKNPLENGLTRGEQMELARIAMASLEAEPIGAFHIADQQVGGTSDYIKDGEWPIDNGVIDVYAVPPVLVVPEERPSLNNGIVGFDEGWNACRAAMLHGCSNFDVNGNSPVVPDDWVMVPKEPTDEMIAAAMECDDVVFDSKDPTAFCVQFREIYCAMVTAAPKPEVNSEYN